MNIMAILQGNLQGNFNIMAILQVNLQGNFNIMAILQGNLQGNIPLLWFQNQSSAPGCRSLLLLGHLVGLSLRGSHTLWTVSGMVETVALSTSTSVCHSLVPPLLLALDQTQVCMDWPVSWSTTTLPRPVMLYLQPISKHFWPGYTSDCTTGLNKM